MTNEARILELLGDCEAGLYASEPLISSCDPKVIAGVQSTLELAQKNYREALELVNELKREGTYTFSEVEPLDLDVETMPKIGDTAKSLLKEDGADSVVSERIGTIREAIDRIRVDLQRPPNAKSAK